MKKICNKNKLFMIKEIADNKIEGICTKRYSEENSLCQILYKLNYPYRKIDNMWTKPVT